MSTTLANIHVLNGDEQQISKLLPNAIIGQWSDRFISAYAKEFIPGYVEGLAEFL